MVHQFLFSRGDAEIAEQHSGGPLRRSHIERTFDPQPGPLHYMIGFLILSRGRHIPGHRQVREESLDFRRAHFLGMPLLVEENELSDPMDRGLLGSNG